MGYHLSKILQKVNTFTKEVLSEKEGQSFFEFILLLLVLMLLSFTLLRGFNHAITELWRAFIMIVAVPTKDLSAIRF